MSVHEVGVSVQRGDAGLDKCWPICSGDVGEGLWALVMMRVNAFSVHHFGSPGEALRAQECDWTEGLQGKVPVLGTYTSSSSSSSMTWETLSRPETDAHCPQAALGKVLGPWQTSSSLPYMPGVSQQP